MRHKLRNTSPSFPFHSWYNVKIASNNQWKVWLSGRMKVHGKNPYLNTMTPAQDPLRRGLRIRLDSFLTTAPLVKLSSSWKCFTLLLEPYFRQSLHRSSDTHWVRTPVPLWACVCMHHIFGAQETFNSVIPWLLWRWNYMTFTNFLL